MVRSDRYKTILVIVTGLLAFSVIFDLPSLGKVALVAGVLSIFIPFCARVIEWIWLKLSLGLGWTNSRVLLSIIYFGLLVPVAMVSRLFTRDPLSIHGKRKDSLFVTRNHSYKKDDLKNIW